MKLPIRVQNVQAVQNVLTLWRSLGLTQGNVKVSFTLLNWIHNSRLSKNPPSPLLTRGNRKSPFVKGDLEGFSSAQQHDFDETLGASPAAVDNVFLLR